MAALGRVARGGGASLRLLLGLVLASLGVAGWFALRSSRDDAAPRPQVAAPAAIDRTAADPSEPKSGRASADESGTDPAPASTSAIKSFSERGWLVQGRVVDGSGDARVGIEVCPEGARASATRTDAGGGFRLRASSAEARIVPRSAGDALVAYLVTEELVLVVEPAITVAGRVLDEDGAPIVGAEVRARVTSAPILLERTFDSVTLSRWTTTSGADGRFSLERLPAATTGLLEISCTGFERAAQALPADARHDMILTLTRDPLHRTVTGTVLSGAGEPVPGAEVQLGEARTRSDASGAFRLECTAPRADDDLVAAHRPGGLARVADLGGVLLTTVDAPLVLELRLREPSGKVAGVLLAPDGRPHSGWRVSVAADDAEDLRPLEVCETDDDGRFQVGGDFAGPTIRLEAWDKQSRTAVLSAPIAVGTRDLRWVVGEQAVRAPLLGLVVAPDASPLGRVRLEVAPVQEGRVLHATEVVRTGADGSFHLEHAPQGRLRLALSGAGVVTRTLEIEAGAGLPERIELQRTVECTVLPPDARTCWIEFRGTAGQPLPLEDGLQGHGIGTRLELTGGAARRVRTSEAATEVVLGDETGELRRQAVDLRPDRLTVLRL